MKKRFLIIPVLLLAASITACGRKEKPYVDNRVPRDLNQVLTNEMSEFEELRGLDERVERHMKEFNLRGAQLCIMKNDSLVYAKGYGWADKENDERMSPRNIMRMASISKLLTATGIIVLEDQGRLSLKDKVFGPHGILSDSVYTKAIKDTNYFKITVEDLLRHEAGFTSRVGGDPMFSTRSIMRNNRLTTPPDNETLLRIMLRRPLAYVPGTEAEYSNFGFMVASMVIEKVTGQDYGSWMQENVLLPALCKDFHIANNYYSERHPGEVRYYVPAKEEPIAEYNNSGRKVVRCYGGNDIHALSGAGAWVGSAPELARFVASIDIRPSIKDIISREGIHRMVEYFDEDTYSLGWNDTDPDKGWKRSGSFSGTNALIFYYPDGECWIFMSNSSTWKAARIASDTEKLFIELREQYSSLLPDQDLFFYPDMTEDEETSVEGPARKKKEKEAKKRDRNLFPSNLSKSKDGNPVKENTSPKSKKDDLGDISEEAVEILSTAAPAPAASSAPKAPVKRQAGSKNGVNSVPPSSGVKVPTVLFPSE